MHFGPISPLYPIRDIKITPFQSEWMPGIYHSRTESLSSLLLLSCIPWGQCPLGPGLPQKCSWRKLIIGKKQGWIHFQIALTANPRLFLIVWNICWMFPSFWKCHWHWMQVHCLHTRPVAVLAWSYFICQCFECRLHRHCSCVKDKCQGRLEGSYNWAASCSCSRLQGCLKLFGEWYWDRGEGRGGLQLRILYERECYWDTWSLDSGHGLLEQLLNRES